MFLIFNSNLCQTRQILVKILKGFLKRDYKKRGLPEYDDEEGDFFSMFKKD